MVVPSRTVRVWGIVRGTHMSFDLTPIPSTSTGVHPACFIALMTRCRIAIPYTVSWHIVRVNIITLFMFL